jgi:prevent-host-death family protein
MHASIIYKGNKKMTTITGRDFNQNAAKARQLAEHEPIFVTDHGEPSHVLMSYALYQRLTHRQKSNAARVSMSEEAAAQIDDDFEFGRVDVTEREEQF